MDGLRDAISKADTVMTQPEIEKVAQEVEGLLELYSEALAPKDSVLSRADALIHGERLQHYGAPEVNFKRIASAWTEFLSNKLRVTEVHDLDGGNSREAWRQEITPIDVCIMMVLLKSMRMAEGYHSDSVADIAGYVALAAILEGEDQL